MSEENLTAPSADEPLLAEESVSDAHDEETSLTEDVPQPEGVDAPADSGKALAEGSQSEPTQAPQIEDEVPAESAAELVAEDSGEGLSEESVEAADQGGESSRESAEFEAPQVEETPAETAIESEPEAAAPAEEPEASAEESEADDTANAAISESMWASVRDRDRAPVLTGEEVGLPGEITDADEIFGEALPVDTAQIEAVTQAPATTIPAASTDAPVDFTEDPTPTPLDVFAQRQGGADADASTADFAAGDEDAPSGEAPIDSTAVLRRSLLAVPVAAPAAAETAWMSRAEDGASQPELAPASGGEDAADAFDGADAALETPYASAADEAPADPQAESAEDERPLDESIFEGATLVDELPSRASAHWVSLLAHLVIVPVAWYLIADAGARFTLADDSILNTGRFSALGLGELIIAIVGLVALLLTSRKSSVGAWLSGAVTTVVAIPWLMTPAAIASVAMPALQRLDSWNAFGANLVHHFQASAYSGRLLICGLALMGVGYLSHSVRRQGRAEEAVRAQVEKVNPSAAHFSARARRKAKKAAGLR